MNKTRYSATEFGGNKPINFRPSGTLNVNHNYNKILESDWLSPAMIYNGNRTEWICLITSMITDRIG